MRLHARAAMAALILGACAAEAKPPASQVWLSGYWLSCADGQQTTETWSDLRDGVMVGTNVTSGSGKATWEFLRIGQADGGLTYIAQPSGQPPVEFALARDKSAETKFVFENPAHDFPQRIIYERKGQVLTARIEGTMDGKLEGMEWSFTPAPLNQPCPG